MKLGRASKLIASVLLCEVIGVSASVFTIPAITTWYASLSKPWFNPPNWLFGPAWTVLFALMGISVYLVWESRSNAEKKKNVIGTPLKAFSVQFALNILWSLIFFGMRLPFYALLEIIALWVSIAATIYYFNRVSRKAALLLLPYIAWVTFAAVLNYYVWALN